MQSTTRREIVLPETKPETEWLRGRAVRKMSPRWVHAALQGWWLLRLSAWADGRGRVGTEWRFRVSPPDEDIRPLVPDVSYLSYERAGALTEAELQTPLVPPTAAIEIRSPGDSLADIEDKAATLMRAGTDVVIVVNPRTRTVTAWDREKRHIFSRGESFQHVALPGFTFELDEMFEAARFRPRKR
ncbi:MAG: Uma2 family endonuclease [Candidatus Eremiobacteraeota bacterium]|nr:Uma2 family endonuclease [Candidatus Eremiobacteraeota bacterium]